MTESEAEGADGLPLELQRIDARGEPECGRAGLPPVAVEVLDSMPAFYARVGFVEPWIGYLATRGGEALGTCGFKGPPESGRVEIAYFTFPEHEGRGVASAMARGLIALAAAGDPAVTITAQTLPGNAASARVLEKLGFRRIGRVEHPEDGVVLEWELGGGAPPQGMTG